MTEWTESHPPWTDEEINNINHYQRSGAFHPFTCGCPHPERNDRLTAFKDGLRCAHCGWHQTWVFAYMANGEAMTIHDRNLS